MNSIQLIRLLDVLEVNSIRNATGVSPRSIIVTGQDFKNVEQVLIDGLPAPAFVTYSTTELIAEVPLALRQSTLRSVNVLSNVLTLTDRSMVEFTFGVRPKIATGTLRLMQTYLRILLRTPGSNKFHTRSGGGLLNMIGKNISNTTAADVAVAVQTAKQYVINVQTSNRNLPPSERLLDAEIKTLDVDPLSTSVFLTVALTSHSGRVGTASLET